MVKPTPRVYSNVHRVDAVCPTCDSWTQLDLESLIKQGYGDTPLVDLPLRCRKCGKKNHCIIVSGQSYPLGEMPEK